MFCVQLKSSSPNTIKENVATVYVSGSKAYKNHVGIPSNYNIVFITLILSWIRSIWAAAHMLLLGSTAVSTVIKIWSSIILWLEHVMSSYLSCTYYLSAVKGTYHGSQLFTYYRLKYYYYGRSFSALPAIRKFLSSQQSVLPSRLKIFLHSGLLWWLWIIINISLKLSPDTLQYMWETVGNLDRACTLVMWINCIDHLYNQCANIYYINYKLQLISLAVISYLDIQNWQLYVGARHDDQG